MIRILVVHVSKIKTAMAEGGVVTVRQEWHKLLEGLKGTAEGLLATPTSNVWNMYGGLNRICNDMENIMNHRLKVTKGPHGNSLDFWNFVCGLRWLNPTMAPTIEQYHKMIRGSTSPQRQATRLGQTWLRQSLLDHNLSSQLEVLVDNNRHYLLQYYEVDAFLCEISYFQAMLQCLHAVELNKAALLADINPILLNRGPVLPISTTPFTTGQLNRTHILKSNGTKRALHTRSASLPTNSLTDANMLRRRKCQDGGHLVPLPTKSGRSGTTLVLTHDNAQPVSHGVYEEQSATDALRGVLHRAGGFWDEDDVDIGIDSEVLNDPLMNMQIDPKDITESNRLPKKSASFSYLTQLHETRLSDEEDRRSSVRKLQSQTAGLLDSILNDDEFSKRASVVLNPESISSQDVNALDNVSNDGNASETPTNSLCEDPPSEIVAGQNSDTEPNSNNQKSSKNATRRFSHQRSSSDVGAWTHKQVARETRRHDRTAIQEDGTTVLSSSLPNVSENDHVPYQREGVFRKPAKGQSLISFLSSQDFHTCAELDKENAHFTLAEGLISAIEQMKWNQIIRPQRESDHEYGDSDEEIQELKQRIRIRRRERLKEKARGFPAFFEEKSETMTTVSSSTASNSLRSSSPNFSSNSQESSSSSDDVHDADISEADENQTVSSNLSSLKESGLSLSMASLYSDVEIKKSNAHLEKTLEKQNSVTETTNNYNALLSAESVAIALLRRFSEKQLPKASELEWLVSEQDAPQQLLPLPDSYPVSPDDSDGTRLRGNLEWAPPRPQIIFNIHPPPKRKVVLAKQNFHCAGCGAKVEPGYTKRYRYCEYLGKYFCPCCHSNDVAYIPGRILRRWDFNKYYVSNFSRDLLRRIHKDPLFNVADINSSLYRKVRPLEAVKESRRQLHHLAVFLKTCRLGQKHMEKLEKLSSHWTNDIHLYSVAELLEVKKGEHSSKLKQVVNECISHTAQCPLCQAKGFICEVCRNADDVIFPFELNKVQQCSDCRSCFHKACFNPKNCPKCSRIEARRCLLAAELSQEEEEDTGSPSREVIVNR